MLTNPPIIAGMLGNVSSDFDLANLSPEVKKLWNLRVSAYIQRLGLERKTAEQIASLSILAHLETEESLKNLKL